MLKTSSIHWLIPTLLIADLVRLLWMIDSWHAGFSGTVCFVWYICSVEFLPGCLIGFYSFYLPLLRSPGLLHCCRWRQCNHLERQKSLCHCHSATFRRLESSPSPLLRPQILHYINLVPLLRHLSAQNVFTHHIIVSSSLYCQIKYDVKMTL